MYQVTITYTIAVEAHDEEQVLDGLIPLLPDDETLGTPRIVITPLLPLAGRHEHALHCATRLHRENVCDCITRLWWAKGDPGSGTTARP
jgi:hypothetical protein